MAPTGTPATTPGPDSGSVTDTKVDSRVPPRSFEASRSAGSMRSSATNIGSTMKPM